MATQKIPIFKTARPGYDVRTAEVKHLTIDSTKNQLKEFVRGSGQVTIEHDQWNFKEVVKVSIVHNLGYQPLFRAWSKEENQTAWIEMPASYRITQSGVTSYIGCGKSRPNDNELMLSYYHVDLYQPDFTKTFDYQYIIYLEPYKDAWDS